MMGRKILETTLKRNLFQWNHFKWVKRIPNSDKEERHPYKETANMEV